MSDVYSSLRPLGRGLLHVAPLRRLRVLCRKLKHSSRKFLIPFCCKVEVYNCCIWSWFGGVALLPAARPLRKLQN